MLPLASFCHARQVGDLSPFDFFRQESSNTDVVVRTEAMMKITVVVALMGPERARNEMLPYLQSKPVLRIFAEYTRIVMSSSN